MDDARIGHNEPPPFERISLEIEGFLTGARNAVVEYPEITSQEVADRFDGFLIQLRGARQDAEKERVAEKAPHLEAGRAVDTKWGTIIAAADKALDWINPKITAWKKGVKAKQEDAEAETRRIADEAKRRAEVAAAEAERLRQEADGGLLKGTTADPIAAQMKADELQLQAKEAKKDVTAVKASAPTTNFTVDGKKKSVSLRTTWSARITSYKAFAAYLLSQPEVDHRLKYCLQDIADSMVRKSEEHEAPVGCEPVSTEKAA